MDSSKIVGDSAITRSNKRGYEKENTFAGVLSFMRRQYTKNLDGAQIVVSGVPLDLATTNRTGARLGPAAVRAASVQMNEPLHPWGYGPCDRLSVIDYGASLSIIHFDDHCDTWADDEPLSLNHGSMFYKAINDGLIDPATSVQVGIRTWNEDFMGVNVLGADWVHEHGVAATVPKIRRIVGQRPTYLTFDIDCLDPAFAPGTGTPVAGGLSSAQALGILRKLVGVQWVGMDVVEVAPAYDHAEITALAAAQISAEMLCLLSELHASKS